MQRKLVLDIKARMQYNADATWRYIPNTKHYVHTCKMMAKPLTHPHLTHLHLLHHHHNDHHDHNHRHHHHHHHHHKNNCHGNATHEST